MHDAGSAELLPHRRVIGNDGRQAASNPSCRDGGTASGGGECISKSLLILHSTLGACVDSNINSCKVQFASFDGFHELAGGACRNYGLVSLISPFGHL